ncbi:MAG: hypothetical protein LBE12_04565 [Planctomycetaceae bacterium]|nr:hypothetical protein [Planctomycetaceae bacterium]
MGIPRCGIKNLFTVHYYYPDGVFQYCRACGVLAEHTETNIDINRFVPLVLRYRNATIISRRYNAIPTATLEISRWDIKICT